MINLAKMDEAQFNVFKKRTINSYANDIFQSRRIPFKKALKISKKQTESLLKDGLDTSHHVFLSIIHSESQKNIGHIWLDISEEQEEAFIYHIEILDDCRGKGLGELAMNHLEYYLKNNGVQIIRLNVFKKNKVARSLYDKQGFFTTSIHMQKEI